MNGRSLEITLPIPFRFFYEIHLPRGGGIFGKGGNEKLDSPFLNTFKIISPHLKQLFLIY